MPAQHCSLLEHGGDPTVSPPLPSIKVEACPRREKESVGLTAEEQAWWGPDKPSIRLSCCTYGSSKNHKRAQGDCFPLPPSRVHAITYFFPLRGTKHSSFRAVPVNYVSTAPTQPCRHGRYPAEMPSPG